MPPNVAGHAEYLLGNYAAAERAEREPIEARKQYLTEAVGDRRDLAEKSTWLAMALARQGRLDEAAQVIAPVVKFHRGAGGAEITAIEWQPIELARALYRAGARPTRASARRCCTKPRRCLDRSRHLHAAGICTT